MADPKYKNLPYIAEGQADVYETDDLPESDQALHVNDEPQGAVETLLVDPKDAFKIFNKATVDSTGSNFSEEAVAGRTGYAVHYEIVPGSARGDETLLQKLQRLKSELSEVSEAVKSGFADDEVNPASVMSEVEALQQQLESFSTEPIASVKKNDAVFGQLLTQLKTQPVAKQQKQPSSGASQQAVDKNVTSYELRMSSVAQGAKEANLEARISQMEQLLGSKRGDKVLGGAESCQSVMDCLSTLSSKMHLLEEDNVDKVSARLQILLQTLSEVKESSPAADALNIEKVNELYELVKKWDSCADALPTIVDRLYALQDLHQQAVEFSANLKALDTAQRELATSLSGHDQLLKDVQKTFTDNVDVINSNVGDLEKRMSALK